MSINSPYSVGLAALGYNRRELEHIHLLPIDEAVQGLDDVAAGRVKDARKTIQRIQRRREGIFSNDRRAMWLVLYDTSRW